MLNHRNVAEVLDALVENSSEAVCLFAPDGSIVFATSSIRNVIGVDASELIGRKASAFIDETDRPVLDDALRRINADPDDSVTVTLRCRHGDGRMRTLQCLVRNRINDPRIAAAVVNLRDVTEQRRAELAAAEADERFRLIATHSRDIILVLDPNGIIQWASPSLALLGRDPNAVVGHHCGEWIHPDDRQRQRDVLADRVTSKAWRKTELRVQHVDGSWIETESLGVPVLDADGNVEKVIISARDITDRKEAERRYSEGERRLRLILSQIPSAVWTTDHDLRVTSSLGGGLRRLGLEPDQMVGVSLPDHFAGDEKLTNVVDIHRRALAGETIAYESHWQGRDVFVSMQPMRNEAGEIVGTIGISLDITDQKRAERRYQALFARNLAGVFRSTISGKLLEANDAFARVFGYESAEEMLSIPTPSLYFSAAAREEAIALIRSRGEIVNFEARFRRKDGSTAWALLNETLVPSTDGDDILEGTIIDITGRKVAEERIEYQAFHDSLTDLPNRFLFNDRLGRALAQAQRHGRSVAVLFLDLDHFKLINDTMAHSAGDELLRQVASRLTAGLRSDDTVARIGGDEFVFVLPEIAPADAAAGAAKVAEKVLAEVRRPFTVQGRELFVTASIGIAISPHDGSDSETLVKNADSAMYRAKDSGRNNYQFHTPLAQRRAEVRLTLETALRRAIEREELFLVYQPLVELATGKISGFETLLRWNRPGFGVVEPKDFIPLAEEMGTIVPIGEWVLRTACRQMREWHRAGHTDLRLSVNLSPRQFQHEKLTRMVEGVLEETGFDPKRLELEITESLSIRDVDLTVGRLSHFRKLGIRAALDDFGTGYSSLGHLRFLPIDSVKIDRSFITDLREEGAERMIVQAIVTMAQSLDLCVIAEGVETDEQRRILTSLGCTELQGFVFSRPLVVEDVERLLGGGS